MDNIIKIVKALEESSLLIEGGKVCETIKKEAKEQGTLGFCHDF